MGMGSANPRWRGAPGCAIACALVCAALAGCGECGVGAAPGPPLVVTAPPERATPLRVVVLSPSAAVIARDLGLADKVVGRHGYDLAMDKALPVCGDQSGIDYEALLRVNPTHIVTEWGAREMPARLMELSAQRGWKLLDIRTHTLREVVRSVGAMDRFVSGAEMPSDAAVRVSRELELLLGPDADANTNAGTGDVSGKHPTPRFSSLGPVLVLVGVAPVGALGPRSCHGEVVRGLGAVVAPASGPDYAELTHEDLLRIAPGVIVFLRGAGKASAEPGSAAGAPESDPFGPLRGLALPAFRESRILVVDDPLCQLSSSSLRVVAGQLRAALERWEIAARAGDAGRSGSPAALPPR